MPQLAWYVILDDPAAAGGKAIKCLICGLTSYNPYDVEQRYCAACHRWHEPNGPLLRPLGRLSQPGRE